jgi:hypothetical protein
VPAILCGHQRHHIDAYVAPIIPKSNYEVPGVHDGRSGTRRRATMIIFASSSEALHGVARELTEGSSSDVSFHHQRTVRADRLGAEGVRASASCQARVPGGNGHGERDGGVEILQQDCRRRSACGVQSPCGNQVAAVENGSCCGRASACGVEIGQGCGAHAL